MEIGDKITPCETKNRIYLDMEIKIVDGRPTRMFGDEFKIGRRTFRKIAEDERWYIFEVEIKETPKQPKEENLEVILKRIRPKSAFDTNEEYTHIEKYPNDEQWGDLGWTATNIEYAYRIIHRINEERKWGETALGAIHTPKKAVISDSVDKYKGTEKI